MKKEDVKVEVTDGHLAISGERKSETEEKKGNVYRRGREYGSFYRAPLPDGAKLEEVKATFADGLRRSFLHREVVSSDISCANSTLSSPLLTVKPPL